MLRGLVLVLVLANGMYFAWTRGALAAFGAQPARFAQREPQRLAQQVRPGMLRIVKVAPAAPDAAPSQPRNGR